MAKRLCDRDRVSAGKPILLSIVRILVKLSPIPVGRETTDSIVREEMAVYAADGILVVD